MNDDDEYYSLRCNLIKFWYYFKKERNIKLKEHQS